MSKIKVTINGQIVLVNSGTPLIKVCEDIGVEIPRFCYHEKLKIAGNCRMCLVEMVHPKSPKPVASCATIVTDGMVVDTGSELVRDARKGVMKFLLANHPLDCPICDQAGECDLQDQAFVYGEDRSVFSESKRAVVDKYMGPLIATNMTRCIHCKRCTRFLSDIAGQDELGGFGRGEDVEIATYLSSAINSELSGNIIDLCPVGALTSRPYAFQARSWELNKVDSIDVMDGLCSNIRIDTKNQEIMRILPRPNPSLNEEWISDKTRFSYDGLKLQRIDACYAKKDKRSSLSKVSPQEALGILIKKIGKYQKDEIAIVTGDHTDLQTHFLLKNFVEQLGLSWFDCRQRGEAIDNISRSHYLFNTGVQNVSKATSVLFIGCNPKIEAPVLNTRFKQLFDSGVEIASIGSVCNFGYEVSQLGEDLGVLYDILNGSHEYSKVLMKGDFPMMVVGQSAIRGSYAKDCVELVKQIANKYNLNKPSENWNGFNVLHGNPGIVGGLEMGFVSKKTANLGIGAIVNGIKKEKVKMLISFASDELPHEVLGDVDLVYFGSHCDVVANYANLVFPSSCYTEKEALYMNTEGRIQSTYPAVIAPGEARDDSAWILDLAAGLKLNLSEFANGVNAALFSKFSHLKDAYLNFIPNYKPIKSDVEIGEGKIKKIAFCAISDFYMTNFIARLSPTMAKCNSELISSSDV